jgi:hypothetical protein
MIRKATILFALVAILVASAPRPAAAQAATETVITIAVECGAQGVVDDDWTLEFDLCDPMGKMVNTKGKIVVSVRDGTGSRAAADRAAIAINQATGKDVAMRRETNHQKYGGDSGHKKAEDLVLKEGYTIKNVITKKLGVKKDDHLQIYLGKTQLNPGGGQSPSRARRGTRVDPDVESLAASEPMTIEIGAFDVEALALELFVDGFNPDGTPYLLTMSQILDGDVSATEVTTAIGLWAQSQGIPVEYPTANSVTLRFDLTALHPINPNFAAYLTYTDVEGVPGKYVTFTVR